MGNTHSAGSDFPSHPSPVIMRKRSKVFSALTLGCTSTQSTAPLPTYHHSPDSRSSSTLRDEKPSFDPPPLYAYSIPDILEDAASADYKTFLKQYPEYQLTWTLDALRRSDFARLDRSGETYVDYMGGSLYPESLIRVHTGFLHRHILGNTHSVSNA